MKLVVFGSSLIPILALFIPPAPVLTIGLDPFNGSFPSARNLSFFNLIFSDLNLFLLAVVIPPNFYPLYYTLRLYNKTDLSILTYICRKKMVLLSNKDI